MLTVKVIVLTDKCRGQKLTERADLSLHNIINMVFFETIPGRHVATASRHLPKGN